MSCSNLKNIVIPDGVTKLSVGLFYECSSLESITIPASITEIGIAAFYSCTNLKTVKYQGTKSDWETKVKPNISSVQAYGENGNIALSRATIICTDGDIPPSE
ncbi:leucine-rich repeat protein [uncultured Treponema sp.]|uniref:leucine-rich repeat protein n=1 Tax=Treponema sp. TaxID=166 RepID=UPI0025E6F1D3|nr:leucine-rich repeat protein [uncultured Treponema sp.]